MDLPILSILIFFPLLGSLPLLLPIFSDEKSGANKARLYALGVSIVTFVLSLNLYTGFDLSSPAMQFTEQFLWVPSFGIHYALGIDGISLFLVLLTTFMMPIVVLSSASVDKSVRGYLFNMLLLEAAMIGSLSALDLFLFYVFYELMLFPMYFIIGIWGGKRRIYATIKFVLYTVFGSLLMLVSIFYIAWAAAESTGEVSFLLSSLLQNLSLSGSEQFWLFAAFALAFGIKVPIFPFHTWLPDAHVEAPTGGSVILAGILLKMGLYGYMRFAFPLLPLGASDFVPLLAVLSVIGIVYGALVAWVQPDIKKLVAYSSVSHLGYCVLGFVALNLSATSGSLLQMINHGISTGALFLLVGVLYDRRHTREISEYGGLASKVPVFAFMFLVFTLSSIALPLTNGFIGEFLILSGSFKAFPLLTAVAVLGVVLGAVYMLTLYLRTMFGELDESKNGKLTDINMREMVALAPLFVLVFYIGIYPKPFLDRMEPTLKYYLSDLNQRMLRPTGGSPGMLFPDDLKGVADHFQVVLPTSLESEPKLAKEQNLKLIEQEPGEPELLAVSPVEADWKSSEVRARFAGAPGGEGSLEEAPLS